MEYNLPKDPVMLLSFVNTQLRDHYSSYQDFCAAMNVEADQITEKLSGIGYVYDETWNQFI